MIIRLLTAAFVATILAGAGMAYAAIDTAIEPGSQYVTACDGGPVGVAVGSENDVLVACALSEDEHVICGLPGVLGWQGDAGQIVVTCSAGPK